MRRHSIWLLPLLAAWCAFQAVGQTPLASVHAVKLLTLAQAEKSFPVNLQATVTYVRPQEGKLFVSDAGYGVYVKFKQDIGLIPGDRVVVTGVTYSSFAVNITATQVRFVAHGSLPAPRIATFEDLIQSRFDAQYVQIDGHVLAAEFDPESGAIHFTAKVPQGELQGVVRYSRTLRAKDLLDADVRMTGVAGGRFTSNMQMAGVWLDIYSDKDMVVIHPPASNPWSNPDVPIDHAVFGYRNTHNSQRIQLVGTLTYFEPNQLAIVEQQGKAILVETNSTLPLHAGQTVEVTGFPAIQDENVRLEYGELRPAPQTAPARPQPIQWEGASAGEYPYNLVSMEGVVVGLVHDSRVDVFIVLSGGHLFSATLRHSSSDAADPIAIAVEPTIGSRVRVTGVCFVDAGNHWSDRLWFDLRMRSLADVTVLQIPSWWTVKHLAYTVMFMSGVILAAVLWAAMLGRRLRKQTAEDATRERLRARYEQQRSQILERISSSAPTAEVLNEIQNMVSSRLNGVPCRFVLFDHGEAPARRERPSGPSPAYREIFSPNGDSLGYLMVTEETHELPLEVTLAALESGGRLAELAIDTRRLYSDLRHRSEYDLLTDIPNRFSMERKLDQLMQSARTGEAVFGLIYVDLDCFKQVNDIYGHRIGDLYLIEAARRMKVQLRDGDVLARIGGDEFIALVPILRSHADAEEIAERLERCFDSCFELEGYTLRGSASVGLAVYPEDGATKEELQRAADVAMYGRKEAKRCQDRMVDAMQHRESEDSTSPVKR
jgi:diguanylate cyclase (GGDEF)-like protein